MGFTKDLWKPREETQPDGTTRRAKSPRHGKGKRWLSVWHDEDGAERSKAFAIKDAADKHWQAMETDRARGEYVDPKAGREKLAAVGKRWLASRVVDPATMIRYESLWRLHVEPEFGHRQVRGIKPGQVQDWLAPMAKSTAAGAFLVMQGVLDLAVADGMRKDNPCKSSVVDKPRAGLGGKVKPWPDAWVDGVTDAHPAHLRLLPVLMSGCGLRIGEATAITEDDFDFEEQVVHVRRQLKMLGTRHVFALPKSDLERDVPMSGWVAAAVRMHIAAHGTWACTLPWEKVSGRPQTHALLFRWSDGSFVRYRTYSELTWKPAIAAAGVIPEPAKDKRGRLRYETTRKEGPHQLRHWYASVMLHGGATIKELAEFMGHGDPSFTLRVYTHLQPGSHERARKVFDDKMFRPRAVVPRNSDGTGVS